MSTDRPPSRATNGPLLALAWAPLAVAAVGGVLGVTSTSRISEPWEFTAAMVHGAAVTTFAVIFAISALTIGVVVTERARDRPSSPAWRGFAIWQAAVVLLGGGWVLAVPYERGLDILEMVAGLGVAAASIGACVQAARPDAESAARRRERIVARAEARTPQQTARLRALRVALPAGIAAALVLAIAVAAVVPITHDGCRIVGSGTVSTAGGTTSTIDTEGCGAFVLDARSLGDDAVEHLDDGVDDLVIVSRGFAIGTGMTLLPLPVAVSIEPAP